MKIITICTNRLKCFTIESRFNTRKLEIKPCFKIFGKQKFKYLVLIWPLSWNVTSPETGSYINYVNQCSNFAGKPMRNMCHIGTGSLRFKYVNSEIYIFGIFLRIHQLRRNVTLEKPEVVLIVLFNIWTSPENR